MRLHIKELIISWALQLFPEISELNVCGLPLANYAGLMAYGLGSFTLILSYCISPTVIISS